MAAAAGTAGRATSAATSSGWIRRPIGGSTGARRARAGSSRHGGLGGGGRDHVDRDAARQPLRRPSCGPGAISAALVAAYWLRPALPCATRLPMQHHAALARPRAIAGSSTSARRMAASTCRRHISSPSSASRLPSGPTRSTPAACTSASDAAAARGCGGSVAWRVAQVHRHGREARRASMAGGATGPGPSPCQPSASSALRNRLADARAAAGHDRARAGVHSARMLPFGDDLQRACAMSSRWNFTKSSIVPAVDEQALRDQLVAHVGGQRLVDLGIEPGGDVGRQLRPGPTGRTSCRTRSREWSRRRWARRAASARALLEVTAMIAACRPCGNCIAPSSGSTKPSIWPPIRSWYAGRGALVRNDQVGRCRRRA